MNSGRPVFVIDTGPLSHFARSQWLGVLKAVFQDARVVIPDVVESELRAGVVRHQHLQTVLDANWIEVVPLVTDEQLSALAYYTRRLVGPAGRNVGECGVLALAETLGSATAVIDDRVGVRAADERHLPVRRTLAVLCDAIRRGLLTVPLVSAVADDLIANSYRLPFEPGGFARWADDEGGLGPMGIPSGPQ